MKSTYYIIDVVTNTLYLTLHNYTQEAAEEYFTSCSYMLSTKESPMRLIKGFKKI
ncbi:MAG: hypothetical protein Unbinned1322contig1000_5 [Prokaryotic dsDNA virus sp.]|nr:MAG: hypothetical protein Unbinned1322contig1000_5 [Prokaryotic dsDNA virus sp.]